MGDDARERMVRVHGSRISQEEIERKPAIPRHGNHCCERYEDRDVERDEQSGQRPELNDRIRECLSRS